MNRVQISRFCLSAVLLLLCFIISSCSNDQSKIVSSAPLEKPKYSHAYFRHDKTITWNSSYKSIVSKYGTPHSVYYGDEKTSVTYLDPEIAGYTFNNRRFDLDSKTGRIKMIALMSERLCDSNNITASAKKQNDDVYAALKSMYGDPTTIYENGIIKWENVYAETVITFLPVEGRGLVAVWFENTHDYSGEKPYELPSPTSKPLPNTQGF